MNVFNYIRKWINKVGTYRMITDPASYDYPAFIVEVRGLFMWHTVKVFVSADVYFARNCADELLDMLNEVID